MTYYKLPDTIDVKFEDFKQKVADFQNGKMDAAMFKNFRVPFGIYEQRKPDTYMIRVRLACGLIPASKLSKMCEIAKKHADGSLHVTTRGDLQFHNVVIENMIPIVENLHSIGLSSIAGGGNTLRNIIADIYPKNSDSLFDVSVHGAVLTTKLLEQPDSYLLPRKFKIAFSSSSADRANATISDVGFIAKKNGNKRGFSVWCGGGMGAKSRLGTLLYDFIDESEVYVVSEAIKRVFNVHGDRKRKHKNRLRFLIEEIGFEEFSKLVAIELDGLKKDSSNFIDFDVYTLDLKEENSYKGATIEVDADAYEAFQSRFITTQNNGKFGVKIPLVLGDIDASKLNTMIQNIQGAGENLFRFGTDQNLYLYDIDSSWLQTLFENAKDISILSSTPVVLGDIIACTGASTCQLGIGLSRGASSAIKEYLLASDLDLDKFKDLKINISGCPNNCGKHSIADIGFYGKAGRFEGRLYPAYTIVVGAKVGEGSSRFSRSVGEIPSYQMPQFVATLLRAIPDNEIANFPNWVDANEEKIKDIADKLNYIPSFEEDQKPYYDFGASEPFDMKERGHGECTAGIFELIEGEQKRANAILATLQDTDDASLEQELLLISARMFLVTKGVYAKTPFEIFDSFQREFIDANLIDARFTPTISLAKDGAFEKIKKEDTIELSQAVLALFASMDYTFNFSVQSGVKE